MNLTRLRNAWCRRVAAVLGIVLLLISAVARGETSDTSPADRVASVRVFDAAALRLHVRAIASAPTELRGSHAPDRQPASRRAQRRAGGPHRSAGAIGAAFIGGFVGFWAGAEIGAALDRNCHCDDPGLRGLAIGAPIGAAAGAVAGFMLGSR